MQQSPPKPKIQPTQEQVDREIKWRKASRSASFFYFNFWFVQIPNKLAQLPEYRPAQEEALNRFQEERYVLCLKARQIGWTTLAACFCLWFAFFAPEGVVRQIVLLSRTERDAKKIKSRIAFGYNKLPYWMKERGPALITNTGQKMEFSNGCTIEALPSKSDPARGESTSLIVVDEWAFFENPSEAWSAIEPATNVGGKVIGFSTPNGYGTWFHRFYMDAKNGVNKFKSMFFSWRAVPARDEQWLQDVIDNHPDPELVSQEYAEDDVSCWLKSGHAFFNHSHLPDPASMPDPEAFLELRFGPEGIYPVEKEEAQLAIYDYKDPTHAYVIGADVAGGGVDGDWSVAHVLDRATGVQVAEFRGHLSPAEFGERLAAMGEYYNGAYVGVERNNHGSQTLATMIEMGYKNIHYERPMFKRDPYKQHRLRNPGWHTTSATKGLMLNDLKGALAENVVTITSSQTLDELYAYQAIAKKSNGTERIVYAGNPHDDCVIALAIAFQMMKVATGSPVRTPVSTDSGVDGEMTFGEWMDYGQQTITDDRIRAGVRHVG